MQIPNNRQTITLGIYSLIVRIYSEFGIWFLDLFAPIFSFLLPIIPALHHSKFSFPSAPIEDQTIFICQRSFIDELQLVNLDRAYLLENVLKFPLQFGSILLPSLHL